MSHIRSVPSSSCKPFLKRVKCFLPVYETVCLGKDSDDSGTQERITSQILVLKLCYTFANIRLSNLSASTPLSGLMLCVFLHFLAVAIQMGCCALIVSFIPDPAQISLVFCLFIYTPSYRASLRLNHTHHHQQD